MANTSSAKKRIRSSERRRIRNRQFDAAARTYIRRTRKLIDEGEIEAATGMAYMAIKTLDKASSKGVIHPKNAARRKSRLMKRLATALEESES